MRLFLDANVLVSVLNKEYPLYIYSARVLSLADNKRYTLYTSPVCLAIAFYFSEKKNGSKIAKNKINLLLEHIHVTSIGDKETRLAISNKKANDFEDAMQYYSAVNTKCDYIITEDVKDYYYSEIPVMGCEGFLMKKAEL